MLPTLEQMPGLIPLDAALLARLLLALALVIVLGQLLGRLLRRLGQPPVMGEILAGILLGPSLIGVSASRWLLPAEIAPPLQLIAQLGVVLYMFAVGLELNGTVLRRRLGATLAIAHSGIALPFLFGVLLALALYPAYAGTEARQVPFALFMGVALSVTAFPVLARILSDRGLSRSPLGEQALGIAAVSDLVAWCLLALILALTNAQTGRALGVLLGLVAYLGVMWTIVRPALRRLAAHCEERGVAAGTATLVFAALLLSAVATSALGLHALFGAFLFGVLIPHDSRLAKSLATQFQGLVAFVLLPTFFAWAGMRTRMDLLLAPEPLVLCVVVVALASLGKIGGTWLAARLTGSSAREATALGVLMNTRGLMELIVLNLGLELGLLSQDLFSVLVVMALVTTFATAPLLRRLGVVAPPADPRPV